MSEVVPSNAKKPSDRSILRSIAVVTTASLVAGLIFITLFTLGFAAGHPFVFRFGPADRDYTEGFRIGWARGTTARWAKAEATVALPLIVAGPSRLSILGGREDQPPTELVVRQGNRRLGSFMAGDRTGIYSFEVEAGEPAIFRLQAPGSERGHGIKLQRLALEPLRFGSVLPAVWILVRLVFGTSLLAIAFVASGWTRRSASIGALSLLSVPLGLLAFFDSYTALHLARKLSLVAPALVMGVTFLLPRFMKTGATGVFALSLLFRLGLAFHPSYYFQDLDIHRGVTGVVAEKGALELWRNMSHYQRVFDLGRGSVQGRFVPLPYPPVFHTIAGLIPGPVDDSNRVLGALFQSLVCLLIFGLSLRLFGDPLVSAGAGVLTAFLPEYLLEFLRASYPALLGHLVDLTVVMLLVLGWERLNRRGGAAILAAALAICTLVYNAGPLYWAVFLPLVLLTSSLKPPLEGRARLLVGTVSGAAVSLAYYGHYMLAALPSFFQSSSPGPNLTERLHVAFMGWDAFGLPYLLAMGWAAFVVIPKLQPRAAGRVITAWLLFIPAISIPVFLFPEPLYYFRRLFFALPLATLLAPQAATGKKLKILLIAVLLGWSLYRLTFFVAPFFVTHTGSLAPLK